jgi:NAD(P)-dependent dehydrogenase (short-subunit alcohol dehydrogenase family)
MKTILLTGATDGIGLEAARSLIASEHKVLLHGRSQDKLNAVAKELSTNGPVETFIADMSVFSDVCALAASVTEKHPRLDVLINNAGVLKTPNTVTADGLDIRFVVNTLAPYLLTRLLLPSLGQTGRVVNVSSAAQASVDAQAMTGTVRLNDMEAYSQSKLAITMWTRELAKENGSPMMVAVNPGSLLASKMVKEGFGIAGNDLSIGADILCRAALSEDFAKASGLYFDNDAGDFGPPHADALDPQKSATVTKRVKALVEQFS